MGPTRTTVLCKKNLRESPICMLCMICTICGRIYAQSWSPKWRPPYMLINIAQNRKASTQVQLEKPRTDILTWELLPATRIWVLRSWGVYCKYPLLHSLLTTCKQSGPQESPKLQGRCTPFEKLPPGQPSKAWVAVNLRSSIEITIVGLLRKDVSLRDRSMDM